MKDKRYMLISGSFDKLKQEIRNIRADMFRRLYQQCEKYKREQLPEDHPMKSITYFGMAAANLSMCYRLTEQNQYLEEAKRWIFKGMSFEHWGRAVKVDVDLSAAWLLFGYGLSYNWIKDSLSFEERTKFKEKLILQGERMYKFAIETEGSSWSTEYWQNHNWIDYCGLATAGYALGEEYAEAKKWTEKAKANFNKVIGLLADDGSDYEGVAYWRYGVIWLLIYADLLRDREGIDLFKKCNFLKNTFYYRLYQSAPNLEEVVNFGDCHDTKSGHSIAAYYKFAAEYKISHAQWLAGFVAKNVIWREGYESGIKPGILPEAFLELLWYDPTVKAESLETLPKVKYFEDLGLIIVKNGWESDSIHFSFKASPGGGHKQWQESFKLNIENNNTRSAGHHHPDSNSFILIGYDSYLAIDDGYNKAKMASDHNVILVDGLGYKGDGNFDVYKDLPYESQARIEKFSHKEDYVYMVGEASKLYKDEVKLNRFARNIFYTGKDYFLMWDELESDLPHKYTWQLHSEVEAVKGASNNFEFENGKGKLSIYNLLPNSIKSYNKETKIVANPTSQEPTLIIEKNMKTCCIENTDSSNSMEFLNLLMVSNIFEEKNVSVTYEEKDDIKIIKILEGLEDEIFIINKRNTSIDTRISLVDELIHVQGNGTWISLQFKQGIFDKGAAYGSTSLFINDKQVINSFSKFDEIELFHN